MPDTAIIGPTRTAREMPTRGSEGLPLEISHRWQPFIPDIVAEYARAGAARREYRERKSPGIAGIATFCDVVHAQSVPPRGVEPRFSD